MAPFDQVPKSEVGSEQVLLKPSRRQELKLRYILRRTLEHKQDLPARLVCEHAWREHTLCRSGLEGRIRLKTQLMWGFR
jgi:hypothetical protein